MLQGFVAIGPHQSIAFEMDADAKKKTVQPMQLPPMVAQTTLVLLQAVGGDVRFTLDGSDPSMNGFLLAAGAEPFSIGYIAPMTRITVVGAVGARIVWQPMRRVAI